MTPIDKVHNIQKRINYMTDTTKHETKHDIQKRINYRMIEGLLIRDRMKQRKEEKNLD
jgi:hypothetical protein